VKSNQSDLKQIKQNVVKELKHLSLLKKDRILLLNLIELFDWLTDDESERFLNKLQKLILAKNNIEDQELTARIYSLKTQLDQNKSLEIKHLPFYSMYVKEDKIDIYPKRIPSD
jgi:GTPase SAR1 family protein